MSPALIDILLNKTGGPKEPLALLGLLGVLEAVFSLLEFSAVLLYLPIFFLSILGYGFFKFLKLILDS